MRPVHEPDYFAVTTVPDIKLILDVGANRGQSAIALLRLCPKARIVSIEPNPTCAPMLRLLETSYFGRLKYMAAGAGAEEATLDFHIPVRAGRQLLEEGTFDPSILRDPVSIARMGGLFPTVKVSLPVITVDSLDVEPDFVKIDVQGLELQVLQGMVKTIDRARPTIMLERGPGEDDYHAFLTARGYDRWYWAEGWAREAPPHSVNVFYRVH